MSSTCQYISPHQQSSSSINVHTITVAVLGDDKYVRALVWFLPSMPSLVGPHVAPLIGFVVAEGALKRLVASVRALMHSDLPGRARKSAKTFQLEVNTMEVAWARGSPTVTY
jgi:hypothetical protein